MADNKKGKTTTQKASTTATKTAGKTATKSTTATKTASTKGSGGFSDFERAAMQERARELQLEADGGKLKGKAKWEKELLDRIAEMPAADREIAEAVHVTIQRVAPHLAPKTMYGMPAYANESGKVVCMFQSAAKFGTRYSSLIFEDSARLDDGPMWPIGFAIAELTPAVEKRVAELVARAVG